MPNIKIKRLEEKTATAGLHMGVATKPGEYRRKLEPDEIVYIPDGEKLPDGRLLINVLWDTGTIDMVPDTVAVTRPLDYADRNEAKFCSPTFRPDGADAERDMNETRERVEARLLGDFEPEPEPERTTAPAPQPAVTETAPQPPPKPSGRRTRRGSRPENQAHGEAVTA